MQMLTKFESKSNRVKGIAFHPRLPLLASSLHNGSIQLWNYQTGTIYDRLEEHDGPVRGICFHPSQPLLVSGGDDYKIKVWNHKTRKCLFTLNGHLDYVRTVFFHHEHPWILSASDDQTIRIWNWQSRTCIAILTGHNHYVMCAQFHPKEDLIVSASMDQTVRVWDISGLRKKNTSAQPMSIEEQIARANSGQADLFGNTDAMVKYVLEGHDRGVNWASFHPTLPLIVSAGDDRQIKLWRMSDTKAWEVDTCRGHFNNVSSALFHPRHELIISDAEDKTIRVWDMGKRTAVQTFRRESDRFWVLTAHPTLNLFAAGHDNGLIVFKLERERPAFSVHQNTLYYIRDKQVRSLDYATGADQALLSVKRLGNQYVPPRTLSFNPAERSVIVTSVNADQGTFDVAPLPREAGGDLAESSSVGKRGTGSSAIFVARNRFAVLDKTAQTIEIRDLNNALTKTITPPQPTNEIFFGGTASLILSTATGVILYDIQQQKTLAELTSPPVKYVVWSIDGSMVALLSKHTITLADKSFASSNLIHETIRIKSAAWDESGVLLYSTLNHIKYALPQGDNGIIKTLEQPVYLTRVKGKAVSCLDRSARPQNIAIDPTEFRFKLALVQGKYDDVLTIIKNSNLVGQAIIAFLQKKGYPEIALHFVQDKSTRFDLAIECGNLDVALETAESLNVNEVWDRLAVAALRQGNHKIVERAYQRTKAFDKLSFLYLITGNTEKLSKMSVIADKRGDQLSRFHNALYLGSAEARANVLSDVGLPALAYATAKTNGLDDKAAGIAAHSGMEDEAAEVDKQLDLGEATSKLAPPIAVSAAYQSNWPMLSSEQSYFDRALVAGNEGGPIFKDNALNGGKAHDIESWLDGEALEESDEDAQDALDAAPEDFGEAEEAWDLAEEEVALPEEEAAVVAPLLETPLEGLGAGSSEAEHWLRNSPVAADHAAAGSFETAMTLLSRQAGIVDFAPLKPLFMSSYLAARSYLPAAPSAGPIEVHLRRNNEESDGKLTKAYPASPRSVKSLASGDLQDGYRAVSANKLAEAETIFRRLLHQLVLCPAATEAEATEIADLIVLCREYILGISIELTRRKLATAEPDNVARNLELAALFTHTALQPQHQTLALRSAMTEARKVNNYAMAASFAKRLVDLNPAPAVAQKAQQIISLAERSPRDAVDVPGYDPLENNFVICAASFKLITAQGAGSVIEPLTGARYLPEFKGSLCRITGISEVGRLASGLRSYAA
ncbi:probable COP1 - coatomer complex alpha chain of secretory pathway vesicles [Melanopsichium pennsylvanicum]|uniref:Coatomer subunit alpha n=2 Tax=Melanopsichium pennsylvanicum TaxID=63383 RepID=A0AAJ4XQZ7_9BASI|nr:probable COP1-coatomer complex alpha chain of secretory pathway vesicles [Melanopsichium pennsylvanicum 4]SNX86292.1 probable COP1 - coatomer complex alpha chain of secretory pathway vesicles [Melanopsichium pennsylvanicum]